jgi:EAL domain-containing protein (putative c-di-GMP-specific phosphodiesterase class I)
MPDEFIPLAEQAGVIGTITRWAVGEAVRHARQLHDEDLPIPVAVNLSARDLLDPDLPSAIEELLDAAGLGPDCLTLELTESAVMSDSQRALETLERVHCLGIRLAIDDFGTGYSSLGHLKRLPVDEIKIDKSFVLDMTGDDNDLAIVRTTIDLGHNLGKRVVAEGVETEAAWAMVAELHCDLAQGYFISSAVPAAQIVDWLRTSPWGPSPAVASPPAAEQAAPAASRKRRRSSSASDDPAAA